MLDAFLLRRIGDMGSLHFHQGFAKQLRSRDQRPDQIDQRQSLDSDHEPLLKLLHPKISVTPTFVREDNQAAITTSGEKLFHEKCKHFDIAWDVLRESIALGEIKLWWCETVKQFADIGTKHNIPKAVFVTHRNTIMGGPDLQNRFNDSCVQLLVKKLNELDATAAVYNGRRANYCAQLSRIAVTHPDMDGKDDEIPKF